MVGRVILGHVSATLADLAQRGFLRIEEVPGNDGPEWPLTDLRGQVRGGAVLPFEAVLLDGLFARQSDTAARDQPGAYPRAQPGPDAAPP